MDQHEDQQTIGENFVGFLDPFCAPKGIGGVKPAGKGTAEHGDNQNHHHRSARRVMTDIAAFATPDDVGQIADGGGRAFDELGKAGIAGAKEAPDKTHANQGRGGIARPVMQRVPVIRRDPGDGETCGQAPVKQADKWVPYFYR